MRSLKKMIKLTSHSHYGIVVYSFTHSKKWNIYNLLKVWVKIHYIYIYRLKKCRLKVFINLKTNEKLMINN